MKKTIKLAALILLASATFATVASAKGTSASDDINFSSLTSDRGVKITVNSAVASKAVVRVYDANNNVIFKDVMPAVKAMEKGYILNQLEDGDYTIVVSQNKSEVKKQVHVYEQDGAKTFLIMQ